MLRAEEDYVGDITLRVSFFLDPLNSRTCWLRRVYGVDASPEYHISHREWSDYALG